MRHVKSILFCIEVNQDSTYFLLYYLIGLKSYCMTVLLLTLFPRQRWQNFTCHLMLALKPSQYIIITSVSLSPEIPSSSTVTSLNPLLHGETRAAESLVVVFISNIDLSGIYIPPFFLWDYPSACPYILPCYNNALWVFVFCYKIIFLF